MIAGQPPAALVEVSRVLDAMSVTYHVGGSVASSVYGSPRSTLDVDLVADLRLEHAEPLARALDTAFYVDVESVREAIDGCRSFNLVHFATMTKVDVFVAGSSPFDRSELSRARRAAIADSPASSLPVKSPEDVVLRKLLWYRAGREVSERQLRDVEGVLRVQGANLDRAYMSRWAEELGVADLLAEAIQAAERG